MHSDPITLQPWKNTEIGRIRRVLAKVDAEGLGWRRKLSDDLQQSFPPDDPARLFWDRFLVNENPVPLLNVLRHALDVAGSNLILLESPYLDMDFWDTFSDVYSRAFTRCERWCHRLHFLRVSPSDGDAYDQQVSSLIEALYRGEPAAHMAEYLGYSVVRPVASFNVGRTALAYHEDARADGGRACLKGYGNSDANLLSDHFEVLAVPFVQQDVVTGMCATASTWTAAHMLAEWFDLHRSPFLDITRSAMAEPEPVLPGTQSYDRGLQPAEIRRALARIGARSLTFAPAMLRDDQSRRHRRSVEQARERQRIRDVLFTFMESHIPVVVLLHPRGSRGPGHAVCCVGHIQRQIGSLHDLAETMTAAVSPKLLRHKGSRPYRAIASLPTPDGHNDQVQEPRLPMHDFLASQLVDRFLVHNDAGGPYRELRFLDQTSDRGLPLVGIDKDDYELSGLVIPVPPYIRVPPDRVMESALRYFGFLYKGLLGGVDERPPDDRVLWRLICTRGSHYKRTLRDRDYSPATRQELARLHLPKYIWLAEYTLFANDEVDQVFAATDARRVDGELIFDTSNNPFHPSLIAARFGAAILGPLDHRSLMDRIRTSNETEIFDDDLRIEDGMRPRCFVEPRVREIRGEQPDDDDVE